ncbi:uncharacterized protein [Drosophila tropicalis]|uniref:uncharacterized protein n=1 Tax=Drosophila tropicalis TaxID=46794 RepID=UPI0035ABA851
MCKPCDEIDLDQNKPASSKQSIIQGITERSMSQPSSRRASRASRRGSQPSSPSRRVSRPRGSSAKSARSQGGATSQQDDRGDFCVGLTLGDSENHICKVPSSIMEFVPHDKQLDKLENRTMTEKPISLRRKRRLCKRFIYRRMFRVRARRCGALLHHLEHSLSNGSFYSAASVHTVHSAKSFLSLSSQHAAILAPQLGQWTAVAVAQTDPIEKQCCEVQVSPSSVDVTIQVQPCTKEFGVQAENIGVEHRLLLVPSRTRKFIKLLQDAVKGHFKVDIFRERLLQVWESSEEFRENMELLQNLYTDKPSPKHELRDSWESYEGFVSVVNCIQTLKLAFRPNISTMLADLEENINSRIVAFHNRKIESEYYCTLYYPVERRNSMIFTSDEE